MKEMFEKLLKEKQTTESEKIEKTANEENNEEVVKTKRSVTIDGKQNEIVTKSKEELKEIEQMYFEYQNMTEEMFKSGKAPNNTEMKRMLDLGAKIGINE